MVACFTELLQELSEKMQWGVGWAVEEGKGGKIGTTVIE